ncbi:hypothetical protein IWZ03DRAFT_142923 [Phyllosticta citriasiana]|uniref:Secreted protein n=1 Tax=Phyllosticta citriasiana TaxID=595635 RepID=A0ABR1KSY6_9PEZI
MISVQDCLSVGVLFLLFLSWASSPDGQSLFTASPIQVHHVNTSSSWTVPFEKLFRCLIGCVLRLPGSYLTPPTPCVPQTPGQHLASLLYAGRLCLADSLRSLSLFSVCLLSHCSRIFGYIQSCVSSSSSSMLHGLAARLSTRWADARMDAWLSHSLGIASHCIRVSTLDPYIHAIRLARLPVCLVVCRSASLQTICGLQLPAAFMLWLVKRQGAQVKVHLHRQRLCSNPTFVR